MTILIYHNNPGITKKIARQFAAIQGQPQLDIFCLSRGNEGYVYKRFIKGDFEICDFKEMTELDLFVRHGSDTLDSNHPAFSAKRKWVIGEGKEYGLHEGESLIGSINELDTPRLKELLETVTDTYDILEDRINEFYKQLDVNVETDFPVFILANFAGVFTPSNKNSIIHLVNNQDTYENLLKSILEKRKSRRDLQAILLPAEIGLYSYNQTQYQLMYGTNLVRDLRRQNINQVIWLYSYFSEIELKKRDRHKIFDVPGQKYLKLKASQITKNDASIEWSEVKVDTNDKIHIAIKNIPCITQYTLDDINCFHFTNTGILRELSHGMGSKIQQNKKNVERALVEGLERIQYFFPDQYHSNILAINEWEKYMLTMLSSIEENYERRVAFENSKKQLWALLNIVEDQKHNAAESAEVDWEILFIEDDPSHGKKIIDAFKGKDWFKNGKITLKRKGEEAIEYFKGKQKAIKVVISDWRLFQDDGKTWQWLQGLDVIDQVSKLKPNLAFFILTDKTGELYNTLKKRQRLAIRWFSKWEVFKDDASINEFCNYVKREGDKVHANDNYNNSPKSARWTKPWGDRFLYPLGEYYKAWVNLPLDIFEFTKEGIFLKAQSILADINGGKEINTEFQRSLTIDPNVMADNYFEYQNHWDSFFLKLVGRLICFKLAREGAIILEIAPKIGIESPVNINNHFAILAKDFEQEDNMLPHEITWLKQNQLNEKLEPVNENAYWIEIEKDIENLVNLKSAPPSFYEPLKSMIREKQELQLILAYVTACLANPNLQRKPSSFILEEKMKNIRRKIDIMVTDSKLPKGLKDNELEQIKEFLAKYKL